MNLRYLIIIKNQPMCFPPMRERGFLRPPHSQKLGLIVFNLAFAINWSCLLCEIYPNVLWAEIFGIIPYNLLASISSIDLLGLVYAIPSVDDDEDWITNNF
ncbi:16211_t:CDS:2 [Funneliformis mosseae]|uniref:16211_t:CDS:1 n=1 Tax=Funneliformis mosseae TaxID=27381 RepID=A0A9N9E4G2_FUNMO|nr:16211_t:CDS:2 [Funneliformis mosseae]